MRFPPPPPRPEAEAPAEPEPVAAPAAAEVEPAPEPEPEAAPEPPAPEPTPPPPPDAPQPPPARPALRLDLGGDPSRPEPRTPPPSRFGRGLVTAVLLALLALGAYLYRGPITARIPAADPALTAYAGYVDQARDEVARRYRELRERTGI